jgi:hypothetical protein
VARLTTAQVADVCQRYQEGTNAVALGREFGVSDVAICGLLKRRGIARRGLSECQPKHYPLDRHYFDVIDTEPKAYWLGFLAADGCVTRGLVNILLSERDGDHLERLRIALGGGPPLRDVPVTAGGYPGAKPGLRLTIRSIDLFRSLSAHGVVPNKTLILKWPTTVPYALLGHYLRGYFDGDGCIKPSGTWEIASNHDFLVGCQAYLMQELGFHQTRLQPGPNGGKHYYLAYGGRLQACRIFDHLYSDATVWLPRKRIKFEAILRGKYERLVVRPLTMGYGGNNDH